MLTTTMPQWLDRRHAEHHELACRAFRLRDKHDACGNAYRADVYHGLGQQYLNFALALSAEFHDEEVSL